jgi:hypothetical protein
MFIGPLADYSGLERSGKINLVDLWKNQRADVQLGTWSCLVHDVSTFHCKRLRIRETVTINFQVSSLTTSQVIQVRQNFLEVEEVNKDRISILLFPDI